MEARVHVISREIIKPSSPTPNHLKNWKLSSLDQSLPPFYFSIIFFYQANESEGLTRSNHVQLSQQLKQSLSHTLPSFYTLAGSFKDDLIVDCNDSGVEFIVAQIHAQLTDAIRDPNMADLKQYLPMDPTSVDGPHEGLPLCLVQMTLFDCGGIAIGLCYSHQMADLDSMTGFFNAWAATCRGEAQISQLSFDLANYFPSLDFSMTDVWGLSKTNEKFMTKRFVFDKKKLEVLKQTAVSSSGSIVKDATRVELVSAFIWKNFLEVAKLNDMQAIKIFAAIHMVGLRTRTSPPQLLENIFGNCLMFALATSMNNSTSDQHKSVEEFHDLVSKLRSSIRKIDGDYIREAQSGDNYVNDLYKLISPFVDGELEWCCFSSWCRSPWYEVDYGWGSPIWVCTAALPTKNLTVLMRSKCGDNIEAWVNMDQDNLKMLETQIKLLSTRSRI